MNPYLRNFLFFAGGFATAYIVGMFLFQRAVLKQIEQQQQQTTETSGTPPTTQI